MLAVTKAILLTDFLFKIKHKLLKMVTVVTFDGEKYLKKCLSCLRRNQNRNTFPSSPPSVPSNPQNDPFPRACHVRLNNGVTVSLKANPRCGFFFFFLLPLKHDSEDQISHTPCWPSV